jgi:flagellin
MVVQHNMQAMNANRMLNVTTSAQSKSTEKLSSGYKINRAADDAAGLSISEKMRKQIRGLDQASTNAQDGISAVQTAEGALTEVHSMLQRMNELATQAANGTNSSSDRESIQDEIDQLTTEIDRVSETTKFNETYLLKGNGKTSTVNISAKDAGIDGTLKGVGTGTATFTMTALKNGQSISIGAKGYTIGTTIADVQTAVTGASAGDKISIDGTEYEVVQIRMKKMIPNTSLLLLPSPRWFRTVIRLSLEHRPMSQ